MKTPLPRRIFFWILAVSYFITTSVVLFYVFGYRHDFASKIFVHTGSITVKSNPRKISVNINGKPPQTKLVNVINDSYYISGLRPKKYTLSVFADGFRKWEKDVSVHSGVSTEFWNVLLLRNTYERTNYALTDIDLFFPAPKENIFAGTRQIGQLQTVRVFDTDKNEVINTFLLPQMRFTQNKNENIEWAPNSSELIIPVERTDNDNAKDYAIGYVDTNDHYYLSEHIPQKNLHAVRWDPKERNVIYYISEMTLYRTELDFAKDEFATTEIAKNVLAYDFADDGIYVFNTDHDVLYDHDVKGEKLIKAVSFADVPESSRDFRLDAYDTYRILLLDDSAKDLYVHNRGERNIYKKKLGSNIVGAHFSDDGKKILFYSSFEIFVYFTRDWEAQPIRKEDERHEIIRFSQSLDNVHFSKEYEHVIFTSGHDIKVTELDYRGNRITDTVTTFSVDDPKIINKHKKDRLYFIDSYDETNRGLQSIEFPEKITLF